MQSGDYQQVFDRIAAIFENRGVDPSQDGEETQARIDRIAREVMGGQRDFNNVRASVDRLATAGPPTTPGENDAPPNTPPDAVQPQPRDYFREAKALYPWLPADLLRVFSGAWEETESPQLALATMRESRLYDQHFAGNKRPDGSLRYDEQGYFAAQQGFKSALSEFGLDPGRSLEDLFNNEVSVGEFGRGLAGAYQQFRKPGAKPPAALLDLFVKSFTQSGSAEAAFDTVRGSSEYDRIFAGIKRDDGSLRMDEQEYFATMDGYATELSMYGLNPQVFSPRFVGLISGDVSLQEFSSRLAAADEQVVRNIGEVKQFYADNYGLSLTDEAIFGSFIDPEVGRGVLERRIGASQIGGEAAAAGFQRSLARVERLASAGVAQGQARQVYGAASEQVPLIRQLAARHNDPDDPFDISDFEEATFMEDAGVRRRMSRRVQEERSSFAGLRVAQDQSGGLGGLQRR